MKRSFMKTYFTVMAVVYGLMILMGIFHYIPPHFYRVHQMNFPQLQPPSLEHLLGTDYYKHDIFSEFVYGAGSTFYSGILASIPFVVLGILLGIAASYYENRFSYYMDRFLEVLNAFPKFIVLLIFIALFGNHVFLIMIIFGAFSAPKLAELIKGRVLALKKEMFIDSSIALGLRHRDIIFRHILWNNSRPIILGQFFFIYSAAVLIEASLSYVNLGFSQNSVSWGYMLYEARYASGRTLFTVPWDVQNFHIKAFVTIVGLTLLTLSMFYLSHYYRQKALELRGFHE